MHNAEELSGSEQWVSEACVVVLSVELDNSGAE